jgi:Ca2+-binding RTX toxin-like protein
LAFDHRTREGLMRARLMLVGAMAVATAIGGGTLSSAKGPMPAKCFGEFVTEIGTPGNDDIDLSSETEPQVVAGLGGDDSIHGGSARDRLCGNGGIDEVYGNEGKDKINTGAGRDFGGGDDAADLIKGGPEKDKGLIQWRVGTPDEEGFRARLDGGAGDDQVSGGGGDDELQGEEGDDTLNGDGGTDKCIGGPGHDHVHCERRL